MTVSILLQSSKGGGLAGAFGGASMGAVFGGRGAATFLSRFTTWLAILYLLVALGLSKLQSGDATDQSQSMISQNREQLQQSQSILPEVGLSIPAVGADTSRLAPTGPDTAK